MLRAVVVVCSLVLAGRPLAADEVAMVAPEVDLPQGLSMQVSQRLSSAGWTVAARPELLVAPAPENSSLAEARRLLQEATERYAQFDFAGVAEKLGEVDVQLAPLEASETTTALVAQRFLLAALSAFGDGQERRASALFRTVSTLLPELRGLDPGSYRPAVVRAFAEATVMAPAMVSLQIEAPAGSDIWLNGAIADADSQVPEGWHWVRVRAPGHRAIGRMLEVKGATNWEPKLGPELRGLTPSQARELGLASADEGTLVSLCRELGVEALVVLRPESSVWQFRAVFVDGRVTEWKALSGNALELTFARHSGGEVRAPAGPVASQPATEASWYQTWWGRSAIVGSAAAIAGGILYFSLREEDAGASVSIGSWCFDGRGC